MQRAATNASGACRYFRERRLANSFHYPVVAFPDIEPPDAIIVDNTRPLDNFPLLRSHDIEEARGCFSRMYAKPILMPTGGVDCFNATINACQLQGIALPMPPSALRRHLNSQRPVWFLSFSRSVAEEGARVGGLLPHWPRAPAR